VVVVGGVNIAANTHTKQSINDISRRHLTLSSWRFGGEQTIVIQIQFLANVNSCSRSLYVVVRPSVCRLLSVVCLSVTFVHPTKPIEIFGNVSAPFNTLVT